MEENEISSLVVLEDEKITGVLHLKDLLHAGIA
jgi:CBS domain-containing protein